MAGDETRSCDNYESSVWSLLEMIRTVKAELKDNCAIFCNEQNLFSCVTSFLTTKLCRQESKESKKIKVIK